MPREQRTQLNKRRGTEVPLGKYGSGRTPTVNMPAVAPVKSDGAKLAEAFGMAAQAAGKIVSIEQDKTQKRKAIFDAVEGKGVGNAEAQRLIKEANDLPLEQRNQHIQQGMSNWLENYRGADTTDAFLRGGLQGFTGATDKFEASNNNALLKIQENKLMTATISSLKTDVLNNETHANMIDTIKTVNDVGNAQAGEIYVKTVAAIIKEEAQTDPNYDWQEAINTQLKVITKDGVDYASHPTYGSMIDGLESSLTTLATARTTAMTKANKQVAVNTSKSLLATLYRDDVTPEELVQAQEDITNNQDMFTLTQFKTLETALDNAKDETGYAHTSNPELFSKAKVLASTGKLSIEALNMWKSTLTKSEYNQVFASAVKHEEEIQDTGISLLKNGINDLEKAGRRQVAEINEFGIVMNPQDAAKVTMYDGIWNSYLINYQQENGVLPPYKEVIKEQKDIVQQVKNAFDEEGQEIGTPIPTTDVGGERTGLDKQEWLQTATTDEIRQGLEDGSIKASELQPTSSIMDSVVDVFSPTTLQADELNHEAPGNLPADVWGKVYQSTDNEEKKASFNADVSRLYGQAPKETEIRDSIDIAIQAFDTDFEAIDIDPEDAAELLYMTALHESHGGKYDKQVGGPALGWWQVEPATAKDNIKNGLTHFGPSFTQMTGLTKKELTNMSDTELKDRLQNDPIFSVSMAMVKYLRGIKHGS